MATPDQQELKALGDEIFERLKNKPSLDEQVDIGDGELGTSPIATALGQIRKKTGLPDGIVLVDSTKLP